MESGEQLITAPQSILLLGHETELGNLVLQDLLSRGSSVCITSKKEEQVYGSEESNIQFIKYPETAVSPTVLKSLQSIVVFNSGTEIFQKLNKDVFNPYTGYSDLIWGPLDDVVMGGCSQSNLTIEKDKGDQADYAAVFSGNITSANNGGFASVRTKNLDPPMDLSGYDGIKLKLKGDGQRYKFMLRTTDKWDDVSFCKSFNTVEGWQEVKLEFSDFSPVFRAKTVSPPLPLDLKNISSLQIMLSKFEYDGNLNPSVKMGRFELPIESMKAYLKDSNLPKFVVINGSSQDEENLKTMGVSYSIVDLDQSQESPLKDSTLVKFLTESAMNFDMKTGRYKEKKRAIVSKELPFAELLNNFEI
eukprot:g5320.t1